MKSIYKGYLPIELQAKYAKEILTNLAILINSMNLPVKVEVKYELIVGHENISAELLEAFGVFILNKNE